LEYELGRHIEIYKRYRHPFSLLVIDVDKLAWVNETFGRTAGDSALKHLASLVETNVRGVDIPCRYGGDGFAVIAPETDKLGIQVVGRRISGLVKKTGFKIGRALATVEVCFGTSSCPEDGVDAGGLLKAAAEWYDRPSRSGKVWGAPSTTRL
jgi:diguanylate cyclase (GGDEF)-like protein